MVGSPTNTTRGQFIIGKSEFQLFRKANLIIFLQIIQQMLSLFTYFFHTGDYLFIHQSVPISCAPIWLSALIATDRCIILNKYIAISVCYMYRNRHKFCTGLYRLSPDYFFANISRLLQVNLYRFFSEPICNKKITGKSRLVCLSALICNNVNYS